MESNKTLAGISRYIKKSPKWYYFIFPVLFIYIINFLLIKSMVNFIFLSIIPFFVFIAMDVITIRLTNKSFNSRRIIYLDFMSFLSASLFLWIFLALNSIIGLNIVYLIGISTSIAVFLRFLILYVYYPGNMHYAIILSPDYSYSILISSLFIFLKTPYLPMFLFTVSFSSAIFLLFSYLFITLTTKKFTRKYSASVPEIINFFLNRSQDNSVGESFFGKIYNKRVKIPVKTVDIKDCEKSKVILIFPYVHPGPFGNLCSSNLPEKLSHELNMDNIMVFHTATTNSNNCGGESDIKNIADAVKQGLKDMHYSGTVSEMKKINVNGYEISMQKFGNYGFSAIIPESEKFDDISLESGLKLIRAMRDSGMDDFALIDAQNDFTKNAPELDNCSQFIPEMKRAFSKLSDAYPARIGYSRISARISGLAAMGIQALAMEINGKYNAIVLTDSNNITHDIMEKSRNELSDIVDNLEIYTTDNHVVNASNLDINPLGLNCNPDDVVNLIKTAVKDAINDISDVKIGMKTVYTTVHMGREDSFKTLMDTVLGAFRIAKYSIGFILIASILIAISSVKYIPFLLR
ncbi:DUF2070 family protein [Acidiplasma cupricumulans]|uniref:DUF2070 domain-containing protein n=1 Tax=Acidiplasma cupricumulans TaxID=312540 RepID=A0A0N8VKN3_9ARCH|nr:DUF2070 family protein [Acidiplasma cupricumulans]KQB34204.1 hypothetical protein AOG55_01295 [Acidiplasma cupricumulans]